MPVAQVASLGGMRWLDQRWSPALPANGSFDYLVKAFCLPDITPPTGGGLLSPEQAREFMRVAVLQSVILQQTNVFSSGSPEMQVPRISFANRVMHSVIGLADCAALDSSKYSKPVTAQVSITSTEFRGEVPVCDTVFEDNIEGEGFADTLAAMLAQAVGRDLEEFALKSDTARTGAEDVDLDQFEGLIKQMQTDLPTAQKINAAAHTTASQTLGTMLAALPAVYRNNYAGLKFFVPIGFRDQYQAELATRATSLGDQMIGASQAMDLAFRGIPIQEVPLLSGTSLVNTGTVDYSKFAFLTNPLNIYTMFHRRVKIETWRDPRQQCREFIPSVRFGVKFGDPNFAILAYGIPVYAVPSPLMMAAMQQQMAAQGQLPGPTVPGRAA